MLLQAGLVSSIPWLRLISNFVITTINSGYKLSSSQPKSQSQWMAIGGCNTVWFEIGLADTHHQSRERWSSQQTGVTLPCFAVHRHAALRFLSPFCASITVSVEVCGHFKTCCVKLTTCCAVAPTSHCECTDLIDELTQCLCSTDDSNH